MPEKSSPANPDKTIKELKNELALAHEQLNHFQNQELFLRQVIENNPAPIAGLDSNLRFFAHSNCYIENFGLNCDTLCGKYVEEVFPKLHEDWLSDLKNCLKGNIVGPDKKTITLADGQKETIIRTLLPLKFPSGKTVGIIVIHEVITRQEKTEAALQYSERRFRTLAESTFEAIFISENGIGIETNARATEMFGYTRNEIIGMFGTAIVTDQYKELLNQKILTGHPEPYEVLARRKDGTEFFAEIRGKNIDYQGRKVRVSSVRDIDKEKKSQIALQQSEQRYREMIENLHDIIYKTTPEGNISYISPVIEQITSFTPEEVSGKPLAELAHRDDRPFLSNRFKNKLVQKPTECRLLHKDGTNIWVRISVKPLFQENMIIEFSGVITDISKEKKAEEKQVKLETLLQRSKQMEAIGALAGGVAHDLNNILSGIVSYPDLLLFDLDPDDPKHAIIETIKKSGERAATVVQDLLTLARKELTETVPVNCNELINEYLNSSETELLNLYHPKIQINFKPEKGILPITGSPVHLKKIIMNLVTNSTEAMPNGGNLTISTENRYFEKHLVHSGRIPEGQYVEISIADTGVGIENKDLERIFEPFYSTKKMGKSGTGLGMAVVWSSIQDHKGFIDIKTNTNGGTTILLYLPVDIDNLKTQAPKALELTNLQGDGETILLVDDLQEQLDIGTAILKKLGYQIKSVSSGEEAVEYLKNNSADLVILDMIMDPGLDGLDTYKHIITITPGQKAIIASGYAETDRVKQAIKLGINQFIRKPYSLQDIGLAIRNSLH